MDSHRNITEEEINVSLKTPRDLIKADLSEISCTLCGENFKNIDSVIEHLVEVHKKIYHQNLRMKPPHGILGFDLSSEQLKCSVCQKQFRFFKNLSVHMNEHSTCFMCHVCGKKFISDHRLQTHIMMHKRTNIFCKHCNKDFKTVAARNYHIRKEHNEAPYKCPECSESFTQYHHRLKHLVERHKVKKPEFKCDICGRELASSGGLAAHKRYSHLKTVQYPCEICGKVFAYKWIWQRHMDVHTGAKNFECKFCNKKFAKSYSQQMHERIHMNDKRYVCGICKAAFIQKCSLKNHTKVHHPEADLSKL
ncbi:gastrula zinc finger protein XlCGF8.2DB-like [Ostrinia nubilalis]|uniref:gastrula zinc finger protein XlCGF8.2DB-like n=1 Tax=Ostrinia nubilalis TaxID=29057 RepID=UPI0030826A57